MAKKTEIKIEKVEKEYIIPLREKCRPVPKYRKTEKAIKSIKEFIVKHMKIRDRDLKKVKIDGYLNEALWKRGIKKPPYKIKVKAIKEGDIVKVELVDYPTKLKFKKAREERIEKAATEVAKKKKAKKAEEEVVKTEEDKKEETEKKEVEKEKAAAGAEAAQKVAGAQAKTAKKMKDPQMKQPKHQQRKALAK
ncbi:MAG: 50S ribosomal protein L31e [archaeon]